MAFTLDVNGKTHSVDVEPETPLLWVIRDTIGLTGTKYGCGIAQCGACTVHVDGAADQVVQHHGGERGRQARSPPSKACHPTAAHPLQKAWIELDRAAVRLLPVRPDHGRRRPARAKNPSPSDREIDAAMADNLCRCGTYLRIREAIHAPPSRVRREGGHE